MIKLHIVLLEPEIPQNTGNIGRICKAMNASLHLIEPLGFSIEDKYLKRAGMDYWKDLNVRCYKNFPDFINQNPGGQKIFLSQKAANPCHTFPYESEVFMIFGKESVGLPETLLSDKKEFCVRIPMTRGTRSLNIANAVAILCYEVMRQNNFEGLEPRGNFTDTHY